MWRRWTACGAFLLASLPGYIFPFSQLTRPYQKSITIWEKHRLEDAQTKQVKLDCLDKAHQSILENFMAEKYVHIWRTDQNTPQTNYRKEFMPSKAEHIWAILADFNLCKLYDNETRHTPTKFPKSTYSWSKQFWNPIANVSVKVQ